MNFYRVTADGRSWTMRAKSIRHAVAFLRHYPSVRVCKVRPLEANYGMPMLYVDIDYTKILNIMGADV
jgi:hypothetical protein